MNPNIVEFAKYCPGPIKSSADKASAKPEEQDRPKKAKIIQFRNRLQLSADGRTIILNF